MLGYGTKIMTLLLPFLSDTFQRKKSKISWLSRHLYVYFRHILTAKL